MSTPNQPQTEQPVHSISVSSPQLTKMSQVSFDNMPDTETLNKQLLEILVHFINLIFFFNLLFWK